MDRSPKTVHSVAEFFEVDVNQGVENRFTSKVGLQVPLRNVGGVLGSVYQDVIPGLISRRSASGYLLVPFFGPLKDWICIEDHSAVVEKTMVNQFADAESRVNRCHRLDPFVFRLLPDNRRASKVTEGRRKVPVEAQGLRKRRISSAWCSAVSTQAFMLTPKNELPATHRPGSLPKRSAIMSSRFWCPRSYCAMPGRCR